MALQRASNTTVLVKCGLFCTICVWAFNKCYLMMMMSSWRQSCVQQSHYILLGLIFCYSTPGMLLWAVQKHLKFPFEVKFHCQQASRRESITLTLFSCGFFKTNPQKGFLSRRPWASSPSCSFHSSYLPCFPQNQGVTSCWAQWTNSQSPNDGEQFIATPTKGKTNQIKDFSP